MTAKLHSSLNVNFAATIAGWNLKGQRQHIVSGFSYTAESKSSNGLYLTVKFSTVKSNVTAWLTLNQERIHFIHNLLECCSDCKHVWFLIACFRITGVDLNQPTKDIGDHFRDF